MQYSSYKYSPLRGRSREEQDQRRQFGWISMSDPNQQAFTRMTKPTTYNPESLDYSRNKNVNVETALIRDAGIIDSFKHKNVSYNIDRKDLSNVSINKIKSRSRSRSSTSPVPKSILKNSSSYNIPRRQSHH